MPLTRYVVRNEFSLADPELYKAANKDDPEALMEGVAMAGLVGVLRQLGDLAEFAAEIFHDLHEEVMATAARGHGLIVRVQQLEAEFPSIEKAIFSQTSHSLFFCNAGIDWHPNLHTEHNLVTSEDLPRFVMDSYEECRGPPRLFLLDKFDVAGAGACLKRYTDPSFFKVQPGSSGTETIEVHREKKIRKVKKKGSRWRNGETPEIVPSHAKLHQLFLEERVENGISDPSRLVKLKKKQLNSSSHDSQRGKSYMEKFMETPSEHEVVREISVAPLPLRLTSENTNESELEIVEISMVSPVRKTLEEKNSAYSSPNIQVSARQQSMDELTEEGIDGENFEVPVPTSDDESLAICSSFTKVVDQKELTVGESKPGGNVNRYPDLKTETDEVTSDVDNFMDALTTMESELETDNEFRSKNDVGFEHGIGYVANEDLLQLQAHLSDSQLTGNSSASDGGNSSFKKDRSSFSYSDTVSNVTENMPSDGDEAAEVVPLTETRVPDIVDLPLDQLSENTHILGINAGELVVPHDRCIEEDEIPDIRKEPCPSCPTDSNPAILPLDSAVELLVNSSLEPKSDEGPSVDEPNDRDVGYKAFQHLSNGSELAPEKIGGYTSEDKVLQTEYADENCAQTFISGENGSLHSVNSLTEEHLLSSGLPAVEARSDFTSLPESLPTSPTRNASFVKSDDIATEVDDAIPAVWISSENSTPLAYNPQTHSILGTQFSSTISDGPQLDIDPSEVSVPDIEEKTILKDTSISADGGETDGFISNVGGAVDAPVEHTTYQNDPDHVEHVTMVDTVSETDQAKEVAVPALDDHDDDINDPVSPTPDLSSPSNNLVNLQESGLGSDIPHAATSTECLGASETQSVVNQVDVGPADLDCKLVSHDRSSIEMYDDFHDLFRPEQSQNSDGTTALNSSEFNDQESESMSHRSHILENIEGDLSKLQADQLHGEHLQVDERIYKSSDAQFEHTHFPSHMDRDIDATKSCPEEVPDKSPLSVILPPSANQELDGTKQNIVPLNFVCAGFGNPVETQVNHGSSESCSKDLVSQPSSSENLPQSAGEEIECAKKALDSVDFTLPGFGLLPGAGATQVNLEESPPLPPLPPVQWRMGKVQQGVIGCSQDSLPPLQPSTADDSSQDSGIVLQQIPVLTVTAVNNDESQPFANHSVVMPEPDSLQMQTIANDTNDRQDVPCSTLPLTPNESHEFEFPPVGKGAFVQFSSIPFAPVATTVDAASGTDITYSEVKLIQPQQVAPETDLEVHTVQHTTKGLEGEQVNSLETIVPLRTMEDDQPKHNMLPSSEEEMTCSSNSSALPPVYEVGGQPIKNPAPKIPRPRSPLIQAVAAHDKSTLRKVTERVGPQIAPKVEERDSLLEQIRTKSFNLKPALLSRPSIQGPKTNLKVAAILQKANAIRQACAGSDEDDDDDSWSE